MEKRIVFAVVGFVVTVPALLIMNFAVIGLSLVLLATIALYLFVENFQPR